VLLTRAALAGDPDAAASAASLRHATDHQPGLRRVRHGRGFAYLSARGVRVRDRATLSRIRALAIPPAWTAVWIAADPHAHVQATGRDARGRKQYRYHARWRAVRDEVKYHRFTAFCHALPALRRRVAADLARPELCKRKVVATVVSLMEAAQLRVGNEEYARANGSYGATTLRDRHVHVHGHTLELAYRAKSGVARRVRVTDRRLARIVARCRDLPGQHLFQYVDGGRVHPVTSSDVNAYLHDAAGDSFTAKDFRTWAATIGAALLLATRESPASTRACKRCVREVVASLAEQLGHTPAVCRASYIHPRVLDDFARGRLARIAPRVQRIPTRASLDVRALRAAEPIVAGYLRQRP
jgi:DNA topoisomerase-1